MAKKNQPDLIDYFQSVPDLYLPSGQQFVQGLEAPRFIGAREGRKYGDKRFFGIDVGDKYQFLGRDVGKVDKTYDYDALDLDTSIVSQLRNLLSARGTAGGKQSGKEYGVYSFDPTGGTRGYYDYDEDFVEDPAGDVFISDTNLKEGDIEATGSGGMIDFLDYTNIFDRQSLADTLSLISGKEVTADILPEISAKDVMATKASFYAPIEVGTRKNLLDNIMGKYQSIGSQGFAGSGSRTRQLGGVRTEYDAEMESVFADIEKARMEKKESLSDKISNIYEISRTTG